MENGPHKLARHLHASVSDRERLQAPQGQAGSPERHPWRCHRFRVSHAMTALEFSSSSSIVRLLEQKG